MIADKKYLCTRAFAALLAAAVWSTAPAEAQTCSSDAIQRAVDGAAEALRRQTAATEPQLAERLRTLRDLKGWTDASGEQKAYEAMEDPRLKDIDASASALFAKLDAAGDLKPGATVECARVAELDATSRDLEAVMRDKGAYMLARLDTLIAEARQQSAALPTTAPAPSQSPIPGQEPQPPTTTVRPADPQPQTATTLPPWTDIEALKEPAKAPARGWATTTQRKPEPAITAPNPSGVTPTAPTPNTIEPSPALPATPTARPGFILPDDGYSIDEIAAASEGVFGKVTAGLGQVIEHAFRRSGRPVGYIVGKEGSGALLAGVRYGRGRLYMRNGDTREIFWHGPSIGADIGASGSQVMILVYRLPATEDLFAAFSGIDGSAYVVGGIGITFLSNGRTQLAPIRSGVGLRLGASIGYLRMTRQNTWNPF